MDESESTGKTAENLRDGEDDDDMCAVCGGTPCDWIKTLCKTLRKNIHLSSTL